MAKKLTIALLALTMLFAFTACSGNGNEGDTTQTANFEYAVLEGFDHIDTGNEKADAWTLLTDKDGKPDENGDVYRTYIVGDMPENDYDAVMKELAAKKDLAIVEMQLDNEGLGVPYLYYDFNTLKDGELWLRAWFEEDGNYGSLDVMISSCKEKEGVKSYSADAEKIAQEVLNSIHVVK